MENKEIWASISGGKDSTYMMELIIKNKMKITGFVCALIDEYEEKDMVKHIFRLKEYAKSNNLPFIILKNHNPIEPFMSEVITSKTSKYYGKIRGFPLRNFPCWISRDWKLKLLTKFKKQRETISNNTIIEYIGFAIDEPSPKRQKTIKNYLNKQTKLTNIDIEESKIKYPLVDFKITEEECRSKIQESGLYCDTHINFKRSGCWMCQKSPKESRLKDIMIDPINRVNKIKEWIKISGREIYLDLSLNDIEKYVSLFKGIKEDGK